jgi:hypothetical protein
LVLVAMVLLAHQTMQPQAEIQFLMLQVLTQQQDVLLQQEAEEAYKMEAVRLVLEVLEAAQLTTLPEVLALAYLDRVMLVEVELQLVLQVAVAVALELLV